MSDIELMTDLKRCFNLSPDEPFKTPLDIVKCGLRNIQGASLRTLYKADAMDLFLKHLET